MRCKRDKKRQMRGASGSGRREELGVCSCVVNRDYSVFSQYPLSLASLDTSTVTALSGVGLEPSVELRVALALSTQHGQVHTRKAHGAPAPPRAATLRSRSSTRTGRTAASHFHARRCVSMLQRVANDEVLVVGELLSELVDLAHRIRRQAERGVAPVWVAAAERAGSRRHGCCRIERLIKSTSAAARCCDRSADGRVCSVSLCPQDAHGRLAWLCDRSRICRPFFVVVSAAGVPRTRTGALEVLGVSIEVVVAFIILVDGDGAPAETPRVE